MYLEFLTNNVVFDYSFLDQEHITGLFKYDPNVEVKIIEDRLVYITTGGCVYTLSPGLLTFDGFRNSRIMGCGLFKIEHNQEEDILKLNVEPFISEPIKLYRFHSTRMEVPWYMSLIEYNSLPYDQGEEKIQIMDNSVGRKYFDV